jgi:hypothetical protein
MCSLNGLEQGMDDPGRKCSYGPNLYMSEMESVIEGQEKGKKQTVTTDLFN